MFVRLKFFIARLTERDITYVYIFVFRVVVHAGPYLCKEKWDSEYNQMLHENI